MIINQSGEGNESPRSSESQPDTAEPFRLDAMDQLRRATYLCAFIPPGADGDAPLGRGLVLDQCLISSLTALGIPEKSLPRAIADVQLLHWAMVLVNADGIPTLYRTAEGGAA